LRIPDLEDIRQEPETQVGHKKCGKDQYDRKAYVSYFTGGQS
jgi:hypothetical protein